MPRFGGPSLQHIPDGTEADATMRRIPMTAATALMLGGCSLVGPRCSDCVPPKSYSSYYQSFSDKLVTKGTAEGCAARDLKEFYGKECATSKHFADGFTQAYVDVALGKLAVVPAVPPSKYWNAYYRSCEGAPAVHDWFAGYEAGLQTSYERGVSQFNRVVSSWSDGSGSDGATCGP